MFQDISVTEWRKLRENGQIAMIDVRSSSEYDEATIPESLNIPFFDDTERAEIGTLYKQVSVQAAKERGLEIISAKLPAYIRSFSGIPGKKAVFCWRGGMRSRTTATLLSLMDIHVLRLTGGYRAYRNWVLEMLSSVEIKSPAYVLNGLTGTGKTAILKTLHARGKAVLNLEEMAGHRGSIFGHIGLKPRNQKMFDALLAEELLRFQQASCILFEAENRRIGKIVLPDALMKKRESAKEIWIELPLGVRVQQIMSDYRPWDHPEPYMQSFLRIKSRIHTPIAAEIEASLREEKYERAVELLLVHYYDPRYEHYETPDANDRIVIRASTVEEAIQSVEILIEGEI